MPPVHFIVRSRSGERVRTLGRSFAEAEQVVDGDELTPEGIAILRAAAADDGGLLEVREVEGRVPYVKTPHAEGKD